MQTDVYGFTVRVRFKMAVGYYDVNAKKYNKTAERFTVYRRTISSDYAAIT